MSSSPIAVVVMVAPHRWGVGCMAETGEEAHTTSNEDTGFDECIKK